MRRFTLSQWNEVSQVVSALAVVVSLVYVGREIRANTAASHAATRQAIAQTDFEYVGATLDPLTLLVAETKVAAGEELSPTEHFVLVERQLAAHEPARAMWERFGPSFDDTFRAEVSAIRAGPFAPR